MESDDARATAGYLVYNDRVGEFSNALSEAKATENFDRALSVFTQYAEIVENKTGKKFWSNLDADRKTEFLQSLIVSPQKYVADAAQIANDMTDPDTFDDPTPEGIAKNFAETLENYAASTEESISDDLDRQLEAIAQAEEKTKRQRAVLDERQDLSSTDKKVIGDMLEAFNASVADKFGADAVSDLSIETRTPQVNAEKQEEFAERAGMYEYEQGLTRAEAERLAMRDVFGEEQSEADAFVDTYKSTQIYDDIPFFQRGENESLLKIDSAKEMNGLDADAFSKKMIETLYSFRNRRIPNASIGGEIQIRASSIRKYKSFFADENKRLIVPYIPELLEKAEFTKEKSYAQETESNIIAYWKADVPTEIDDKRYDIHLTVKEDNNGNLFWDAQVKEKAPRTDPTTNSGDKGLSVEISTLNTDIIPSSDDKGKLFYQSVQASIADVSTAGDIKTVRAGAKRYLKEIVRKQDIVHPSLGKITVGKRGIDEFIRYSPDIRKLALVPHLKELIETSTVGMRETPKHPRKDGIVSFIPLYNEAVIDGVPAKTETLIGVDENGNLFYDVFLNERRGRRNSKLETKSSPVSTASDINITISEDNGKRFYQTGIPEIDESRVYNSLPESLKNAVDFVFTAEPVKELTGNEFQKDKTPLVDKVVDYYAKEYDGKVNREGIGDVLLDRRAVKDSIAHGIGKNKAAAFAAVPEVIKNGVIFDETKNYDGYRNDRIVFIAPVSIDNEQYACEVVIKKNPDRTGFYLHEVEITKKLADVFKTAQHGTPASSKLIIARKIAEINSSFDKALSDAPRFYQSEETARGAYDPSERILYLFKNADPSTIVHELGHHFTMQYIRLLRENGREDELKGILDWLGAKSADEITVEQWEKLADAFIVYTKEGFAPSSKLDDLFAALKKYLTTLYEKLVTAAGRLPEISDDVREFFDTMMTVDNETQTDFKELLKKSRDLREVVKGVLRGEALEVNGLSVDDVKALVRQLHARMPRAPQTLEQKIRRAGGIDIDFARSFDLIPLMGASDAKFGKNGLFRRNGAIADETQLTEFLKSEGYIQEAGSERETSAQWDEAVKVLENAGTTYSPADVQQMRDRENAEAAVRAAQDALSGIDYDALLEGLSAFRSVGAVAASKDMIRYIDGQLKRIQSETKRLNKKLLKEASRDTARAVRKEMKQQAKEERDTLKERQKEIVALIRSLPLENKDGLISSVNKAFTAKSLSDILEEVKAKAETYYETEKRRRLKAKIDNFVKKTRPKSTKNQKFDYERNKLFERLREYSKLTQEKAAAHCSSIRKAFQKKKRLLRCRFSGGKFKKAFDFCPKSFAAAFLFLFVTAFVGRNGKPSFGFLE